MDLLELGRTFPYMGELWGLGERLRAMYYPITTGTGTEANSMGSYRRLSAHFNSTCRWRDALGRADLGSGLRRAGRKERKRFAPLTSLLHLQLSLGLLQDGLDGLVRAALGGPDPRGDVPWGEGGRGER